MAESNKPFGPFELVRRLSDGGMGSIYLAKMRGPYSFEKLFVVKLMKEKFSADAHDVQRFAREARIAAQLNHQNIVPLFDFGSVKGRYFICMEYVDGVNLTRFLNGFLAQRKLLPLHLSVYIAAEVCRALHYMHTLRDCEGKPLHLVHRDISPENILVSRAGEVKLSDFGLVIYDDAERLTKSGKVRGKLSYMAPERIVGKAADAHSDQYSLGMVLHELLVGRRYFPVSMTPQQVQKHLTQRGVQSAQSLRGDVPDSLDTIVTRSTALESMQRYDSVYQLEQRLRTFINQHPQQHTYTEELRQLVEAIVTEAPLAPLAQREDIKLREFVALPSVIHSGAEDIITSVTPLSHPPSANAGVATLKAMGRAAERLLRFVFRRLSLKYSD